MNLKKIIKNTINKGSSILGYWCSFSYLYSIYFNFRYLPFHQAKHLPIILYNTYIIGKPRITIESKAIKYGIIRIGRIGNNIWQPKKSTIIFWDRGTIKFQGKCKLSKFCHLRVLDNGVINFGDNFYSSSNLNVQCSEYINFGNNVTLGWNCTIMDTDYHHYYDISKQSMAIVKKPISISDNCWIGFNSIILKGTILLAHSIVSAGSVVSGIFNDTNVIIKGNPARIVRDNVKIDEKNFW